MVSSSSKVYNCAEYAESCGAVLFDSSKEKVCLLLRHAHAHADSNSNKPQKTPEWVLPKGRRHCGEHRYAAALREVEEETGYACHLQPLTMATRAPTAADPDGGGGEPRLHRTFTESFMVTHRVKGDGGGDGYLKLIYWFLAVADERMTGGEEERFTPRFFEPGEALRTVTFPDERMVLEEGIALMRGGR